jgi:hypothetical protein
MKKTEKESVEISLIFRGELMVNGSLEYKTLLEAVDGMAGSMESFTRLTNFKSPINYYVLPPKEGSFHIALQAVELMAATSPLWPQTSDIKDIAELFLEYLKIKRALRGEDLKEGNVQSNNGKTEIKNNRGDVVYIDQKKTTNINVVINASNDISLNKKIDRIATALEKSNLADSLALGFDGEDVIEIPKSDIPYYKYQEKIQEKPDSIVGYIRRIDNRTNKGLVVILEEEKEISVNFELELKEIEKLEKIVKNLALAEANNAKVVLMGEKRLDGSGKLKKLIVNDVEIVDRAIIFD